MQKTKLKIFHFLVAHVHLKVCVLPSYTKIVSKWFQQNKPNLTTTAASENDTK
jgi:hypothetical protein